MMYCRTFVNAIMYSQYNSNDNKEHLKEKDKKIT
jgi:hypothetical protein